MCCYNGFRKNDNDAKSDRRLVLAGFILSWLTIIVMCTASAVAIYHLFKNFFYFYGGNFVWVFPVLMLCLLIQNIVVLVGGVYILRLSLKAMTLQQEYRIAQMKEQAKIDARRESNDGQEASQSHPNR